MALKQITSTDLANKGVSGMPDVPGLSTSEMQAKLEEIVRDVVIPAFNNNALNTYDKTEVADQIAQKIIEIGAGDMSKSIYDPSHREEDVFALVPTGTIFQYAGSNAPTGFLMCDGSAVSRTTYMRLFSVINTLFGVGDGSTTFNIPNLKDTFVIGASTTKALGTNGGESTHTLTEAELPVITPSIPTVTGTGSLISLNDSVRATGALYSGVSGNTFGGGQPHNNIPPYLALNYIIKT